MVILQKFPQRLKIAAKLFKIDPMSNIKTLKMNIPYLIYKFLGRKMV